MTTPRVVSFLIPACFAIAAASVQAAILNNPVITQAATPFNATFPASNLFDNTLNEYASQSLGAGPAFSTTQGTWVQMDFGAPVTMNRMILVSRVNPNDVVGTSRLILSNDATFDGSDTIFTFNPSGSNGQGFIQSFTSTTARFARWEVGTSLGPTFHNVGGAELRFLNTPAGSVIASATAYNAATAFNATYVASNAINGDAGRSGAAGIEYASQSLGDNTFVDFDFGSIRGVNGFDFFDRIPAVDRTTSFNLIFDDDSSTFASPVATLNFNPGSTQWGFGQTFAAINARYVRLDATATFAAGNAAGMQEIIFYAVPEPSAALLASLAGGLILARRRRS